MRLSTIRPSALRTLSNADMKKENIGLYFYVDAKDLVMIQQPEFFKIESLGVGFYIGYATLWLSLASAVLSVMPFKFNKLHARETVFSHKKGAEEEESKGK